MRRWTYEIRSGALRGPDGGIVAFGHSGRGDAMNDPTRCQEREVGPIPPGLYIIGPAHEHPTAGPVTMRLVPDALTEMHGRAGMLIHGANRTPDPTDDSKGCIILGRTVRDLVAGSEVYLLHVVEGEGPIAPVLVDPDPVPSVFAVPPPAPTSEGERT